MSNNWDDPVEMLVRAQAARTNGDRDLAYQMYARASELNPQEAQAWQGRADTAGSSDEALISYAYASALKPEDTPLARTLDTSLAKRIQDATPADVPLLLAIGQELAEVGLTDRAYTVFERASELEPSSTDALVWLAGVTTDDQAQLDYLNRVLAINPRDPRARAGLLTVKLPPPPASGSIGGVQLAPGAATSSSASTAQAASALPESDSPNRMRQIRPTTPAGASVPLPSEMFSSPHPAGNKTLQYILIGLIALVILFAIAGVLLLLAR